MNKSQDSDGSANRRSCLSRLGGCLVVCGIFAAAFWALWQIALYNHEAERFPEGVRVGQKIYGNEEAWGFGPGGAETGLSLYELDERDAERLRQIAVSLEASDAIKEAMGRSRDHRDYREWHQTPFEPTVAGSPWKSWDTEKSTFDIAEFLWRDGGYGIRVEPDVAERVNRVMNSPGAFYATGGGSTLIIVAPDEALVIYTFAG